MKKILAIVLATSSLVAFADADLYVGSGVGAAWNNVKAGGFAFRLNGGYNFNDYLSLEIGNTTIAQNGSAILNQNLQFWDLSLKGTIPLSDTLGLFGQVGGAYGITGFLAAPSGTNVSAIDDRNPTILQDVWDTLTAAGVQYNITKKATITLTDYYYFGSTQFQGNTNLLLAGLKYNF